ncbi:MAG: AraC family transcriptional regulator [Alphaproteobacteria bacterium]
MALNADMQRDDMINVMINIIDNQTKDIGDTETIVPNLYLFRRETPSVPCACQVDLSIVVALQGAKQLVVGDNMYTYDANNFLINSLDLPASTQTLEASAEKPCLGFVFLLDTRIIADIVSVGNLTKPKQNSVVAGSATGPLTMEILEPLSRLIGLLSEPESIPILAPLLSQEIHYRLLMSEQAPRLWQAIAHGSASHQITRAVQLIRDSYDQQLNMENLADSVGMSQSSLYAYFRNLTSMSPLQYQKWLRLHEARHLMLNKSLDAASASYQVGYQSPSQFSREYSNLFGSSPKKDINHLKQENIIIAEI